MVLDLAALMATVHFTGGLHSPLLPFFAFHMAIGTIMIATRFDLPARRRDLPRRAGALPAGSARASSLPPARSGGRRRRGRRCSTCSR